MSFFVETQESLAIDKFGKHGKTMELHLVAKNIAFVIHVAASFDLNLSPPSAKLIYDFETEDEIRDVEGLKLNPLEYVAHVDDSGNKADIEAKISVLSSQHEGAFFRIKFWCKDPISGNLFQDYSQPIKVISKRTQAKKMMERKFGLSPVKENTTQQIAPSTPKKSPTNDSVNEILLRMEEQQKEQMKLLKMLTSTTNNNNNNNQPNKRRLEITEPNDLDFEDAFTKFLETYTKVPQEERPNKMRRVLKKLGEENLDNLMDFVGTYSQTCSGISSAEASFLSNLEAIDAANCTQSNCKCKECPHKRELSRMEDFYDDFFAEPQSPQIN